jgi:hypothetical protein
MINRLRLLSIGLLLAVASTGSAQTASAPAGPDTPPVLLSFGVGGGFPSYQAGGAQVNMQTGSVGFSVRANWGATGIAAGMQMRGFLPLPIGIPSFVGIGVDIYGGGMAPHAVFGVAVPLGESLRFEIEGGAAYPEIGLGRTAVPYFRVSLSWDFLLADLPRDGSLASPEASSGFGFALTSSTCPASEPDPALIPGALAAQIARFVQQNTAVYGSLYTNLQYETQVLETRVIGDRATVVLAYSGSVVQRAGGILLDASGTAEVDFAWRRCQWSRTALRY